MPCPVLIYRGFLNALLQHWVILWLYGLYYFCVITNTSRVNLNVTYVARVRKRGQFDVCTHSVVIADVSVDVVAVNDKADSV